MEIGTILFDFSNGSVETLEPALKKPKLDQLKPHFGPNSEQEGKNIDPGKEEPFVYLPHDHPELELICNFFGLSQLPTSDLFVRNATGDPLRAIYITTPFVKEVLSRNPSIRLLNAGTRLFVKQPDPKSGAECLWRIHSDGLSLIDPFLGEKRVVYAHVDEIWELLKIQSIFPLIRSLKANLRDQILKLNAGGFIIRVDPSNSKTDMNVPFSIPMWRSAQAVKYVSQVLD